MTVHTGYITHSVNRSKMIRDSSYWTHCTLCKQKQNDSWRFILDTLHTVWTAAKWFVTVHTGHITHSVNRSKMIRDSSYWTHYTLCKQKQNDSWRFILDTLHTVWTAAKWFVTVHTGHITHSVNRSKMIRDSSYWTHCTLCKQKQNDSWQFILDTLHTL